MDPLDLETPAAPVSEPDPILDRELSWVAFNGRVLQEALDPTVPVLDRLTFMAIFSSNLDEFFRVRVASIRSLQRLKKKKRKQLEFHPKRLVREIQRMVEAQQELLGHAYRTQILPELAAHGIRILRTGEHSPEQVEWARKFFRDQMAPKLSPILMGPEEPTPFLEDAGLYLVVELWPRGDMEMTQYQARYGLVEVPTRHFGRFQVFPGPGHDVLMLDDILRLGLSELFPYHDVSDAYAVKLTRDADLYLEDEFSGDLVARIKESLDRRKEGVPSRFLYDVRAPYGMIAFLKDYLELEDEDLIPGGRYHNLSDHFGFPVPDPVPVQSDGTPIRREPLEPLDHPVLTGAPSILDAIRDRDQVLHVPYQSYEPVVRFFEEAADDPDVTEIGITLYRVAEDSRIVQALIRASKAGKRVRAFVEVKARFDEARNLRWAGEMEAAGVETTYSMPVLKVHSKLAVVTRNENGEPRRYAFLGTGNFNERTSRVYADHVLLTGEAEMAWEAWKVLDSLCHETGQGDPVGVEERLREEVWDHLLVAPTYLRDRFADLVTAETEAARAGRESGISLKMNALQDPDMIHLLYEASRAGVPIRMVVRGICRAEVGVPGLSETMSAVSIVDRFLEHARVYRFHAGGEDRVYLASADWMTRNLSRRVEVAFPLLDPDVRAEVLHLLDLQFRDNAKARVLDPRLRNEYVEREPDEPRLEAQLESYRYLAGLLDPA
jgi:polyphosphate kinase